MKNKLSKLHSLAFRDIFALVVNILLVVSFFMDRREKNIGHFVNDRRVIKTSYGKFLLFAFEFTTIFISVFVWGHSIVFPSEFSAIMTTFHTISLFAIYKIKPYKFIRVRQ